MSEFLAAVGFRLDLGEVDLPDQTRVMAQLVAESFDFLIAGGSISPREWRDLGRHERAALRVAGERLAVYQATLAGQAATPEGLAELQAELASPGERREAAVTRALGIALGREEGPEESPPPEAPPPPPEPATPSEGIRGRTSYEEGGPRAKAPGDRAPVGGAGPRAGGKPREAKRRGARRK
jgi:hypothetical protein